jgi:HEAT repeat protein
MTTPDRTELLQALASGDDDRAEQAALAVGRLGDAALPALRELLPKADLDCRWWITRALGEIHTDASISMLIDQCDESDPDVRACAIFALGTFGEQAVNAVPALIDRLADPSVYVGGLAADALARIGSAATPLLIRGLREGAPAVRGRAARALAQIADASSIPALVVALEDENPIVEYYADIALQKMGVGTILLKL